MEHGPSEEAFSIQNGDFPTSYVSLLEGTMFAVKLPRFKWS